MTATSDGQAAEHDGQADAATYGLLLVAPGSQPAGELFWCSKQFDHGAGRMPAAEVLLLSTEDGSWLAKPRCLAHPASADVALVRKVNPLTACVILRIAEPGPIEPGQLADDVRQAAGIACGHCGSTNFMLQLGGRNNGAITCQDCRAVLDPAEPKTCSGCGAAIELAPVVEHKPGCTETA